MPGKYVIFTRYSLTWIFSCYSEKPSCILCSPTDRNKDRKKHDKTFQRNTWHRDVRNLEDNHYLLQTFNPVHSVGVLSRTWRTRSVLTARAETNVKRDAATVCNLQRDVSSCSTSLRPPILLLAGVCVCESTYSLACESLKSRSASVSLSEADFKETSVLSLASRPVAFCLDHLIKHTLNGPDISQG